MYRAVQQPLGRHVALKVLRVEGLSAEERHHRQQRFFREAALSSRLNHPNTITVYDYGELPSGDGFFLAMELLEGQTLSEAIKARHHLTVAMMLHVATQIASSLSDAHAAGVIHRDLKPPNVMLVARGANPYFVKVLDFGLVKETAATSHAAELTGAQTVLGSPMYMAPERFLYHTADTPAVDVYALGVLMYEMLVGRPPFMLGGDVTLHHVMMQHIKAPPPRMRDLLPSLYLPQGLEAVVMRCLEKDPTRRYPTMDALLVDLAAFQQNNRLLRTDPEMMALSSQSGEDLDVTVDSIPIQLETGPAPQVMGTRDLGRDGGDDTLVDARISAAGLAASSSTPEWLSRGWEPTSPAPPVSDAPQLAYTPAPYPRPAPAAGEAVGYGVQPMPPAPMKAGLPPGTTQVSRQDKPSEGLGTRTWFLIGTMVFGVAAMLIVVRQFSGEVTQGASLDSEEAIPESVAKRLGPRRDALAMEPVAPAVAARPDLGACSQDYDLLCEGKTGLVDAFVCLAERRRDLSDVCVSHLIQLEKAEYKGLLLRSEARAVPSVRLDPIAEKLLSGDNSQPVLCQQGQEVALESESLQGAVSKDATIVQVSSGEDATLACFSAGLTRVTVNDKAFEFMVGRDDRSLGGKVMKTHAKKFEACVLEDLKETFGHTTVYRLGVSPDGTIQHVETVSSTMPMKSELCGAAALKKIRVGRDKHWRVVEVMWDGKLPAYMDRVVEHVRAARYKEATKLCRPLLEADVMTDECAPLGEEFPEVVKDGCKYLGDSTKALFNCAK